MIFVGNVFICAARYLKGRGHLSSQVDSEDTCLLIFLGFRESSCIAPSDFSASCGLDPDSLVIRQLEIPTAVLLVLQPLSRISFQLLTFFLAIYTIFLLIWLFASSHPPTSSSQSHDSPQSIMSFLSTNSDPHPSNSFSTREKHTRQACLIMHSLPSSHHALKLSPSVRANPFLLAIQQVFVYLLTFLKLPLPGSCALIGFASRPER